MRSLLKKLFFFTFIFGLCFMSIGLFNKKAFIFKAGEVESVAEESITGEYSLKLTLKEICDKFYYANNSKVTTGEAYIVYKGVEYSIKDVVDSFFTYNTSSKILYLHYATESSSMNSITYNFNTNQTSYSGPIDDIDNIYFKFVNVSDVTVKNFVTYYCTVLNSSSIYSFNTQYSNVTKNKDILNNNLIFSGNVYILRDESVDFELVVNNNVFTPFRINDNMISMYYIELGESTGSNINFITYYIDTNSYTFNGPIQSFDGITFAFDSVVCNRQFLNLIDLLLVSTNLTFNNDGNGSSLSDLKYVSHVPTLPILTEPGYNFEGWYYDETFTQKANVGDRLKSLSTEESTNITLYAKWTLQIYNIYTVINGETEKVYSYDLETNPRIYDLSQNIDQPANTNGMVFDGWYLTTNYSGEPVSELNLDECKDFYLYAKFSNYVPEYIKLWHSHHCFKYTGEGYGTYYWNDLFSYKGIEQVLINGDGYDLDNKSIVQYEIYCIDNKDSLIYQSDNFGDIKSYFQENVLDTEDYQVVLVLSEVEKSIEFYQPTAFAQVGDKHISTGVFNKIPNSNLPLSEFDYSVGFDRLNLDINHYFLMGYYYDQNYKNEIVSLKDFSDKLHNSNELVTNVYLKLEMKPYILNVTVYTDNMFDIHNPFYQTYEMKIYDTASSVVYLYNNFISQYEFKDIKYHSKEVIYNSNEIDEGTSINLSFETSNNLSINLNTYANMKLVNINYYSDNDTLLTSLTNKTYVDVLGHSLYDPGSLSCDYVTVKYLVDNNEVETYLDIYDYYVKNYNSTDFYNLKIVVKEVHDNIYYGPNTIYKNLNSVLILSQIEDMVLSYCSSCLHSTNLNLKDYNYVGKGSTLGTYQVGLYSGDDLLTYININVSTKLKSDYVYGNILYTNANKVLTADNVVADLKVAGTLPNIQFSSDFTQLSENDYFEKNEVGEYDYNVVYESSSGETGNVSLTIVNTEGKTPTTQEPEKITVEQIITYVIIAVVVAGGLWLVVRIIKSAGRKSYRR